MSGIRAALAATAVAVLLAPASALAASPGESVSFSIPDSAVGDSFSVTLDGQEVASGIDRTDAPGYSGTFGMPDLGSRPHAASGVIALTRRAGGSSFYGFSVSYRPAASPSGGPTRPLPSPQPGGTPAVAPSRTPTPPRPPNNGGRGSAPTKIGKGWLGSVADDTTKDVLHVLGAVGSGGSHARSGGHSAQAVAKARRKALRRARRAKRRIPREHFGPETPGGHVSKVAPPRDTRVDMSDNSFAGLGYSVAWKLLIAVALVGLALPLAFGLRRRRRKRRAEVEAALAAELEATASDVHELDPLVH